MEKIRYIENKEEYGILYDWKKIRKEYRKLNCPPDVYDPTTAPLETAKYFVENSERNVGKTTNWVLLGMVMNDMYGSIIQYVRQTEEMIMPKSLKDLFSTILIYDYVSAVTHGRWNSVVYKARRYYYCNVDETGKIVEQDVSHFMFCCCVEKAEQLKSSYNTPTGDLIIYDEAIGKYYYPNEFVRFCDLVKTIIRGRRSPIIAILANTINPHAHIYNELEIYDDIQLMCIGENRLIKTAKGTVIYVELIGVTVEKKRKNTIINQLFFGFKNTLLGSITGDDWAIKNYQHIPEVPDDDENTKYIETLSRRLYLYYNNKYVRFDIVRHYELGICIYAHWATRTYNDSVILTAADRTDNRYQYKLGCGNVEKFVKTCLAQNRIYYASNDIGTFVESYFAYIQKLV